jgi:leucyl aminopeptidase (aminopeptidase T)
MLRNLMIAVSVCAHPCLAQMEGPSDVRPPTREESRKASKEAAELLKARQTRPSNDDLAAKLVDAVLVRERDIVLIRGSPADTELLEDIAIAVRRRGAFPVLRIPSDRYTQRLHDDVGAQFDDEIDPVEAQLAATIHAIIEVDNTQDPALLNHIPAPRLAARAKAQATLDQLMFRRGVRKVSLGRGLYPVAATANRYALSIDELDRAFWYACSTDLKALHDAGAAVGSQLASGDKVAITAPNGTDVKFRIQRRRVFINDGVVTEQEARAGGASSLAFLPAGEAYISIVPGSAEGKIVCDSLSSRGREIQNLTVNFRNGKVASINARGVAMPHYNAAGPGKDELGWLSIGLNPDIAIPRGIKPQCPTPAGMVTLGLGGNLWAGGDNAEPYSLALYLPGCTVTVDGAPLIKDGTLAPTPVVMLPLVTP